MVVVALASSARRLILLSSTLPQEFQQAIKALVPQGHTFKGSPLQCKHLNVRSIVNQALAQSACRDIFETEGTRTRTVRRVGLDGVFSQPTPRLLPPRRRPGLPRCPGARVSLPRECRGGLGHVCRALPLHSVNVYILFSII